MGWFVCLCSEVEHNLPLTFQMSVKEHQLAQFGPGVPKCNGEARELFRKVSSWHLVAEKKNKKKKKPTYVPVEFLDKVNSTVHILTVCLWEKKEHLFSGWVFEFRQWSHTEGRVKRLNLSIDLQMLLTALCACCHSSLTQRRDALWQNVRSYCHRIPLYMSVGKPESAGQVLICVLEQAGEYINYLFSCRGGQEMW